MSGRNLEDFFQDTEAFDVLSDEDKARLYAGETLEGETNAESLAEENSESPDAAAVESKEIKPAAEPEPEPVVLAKDGQHTIPFSELEAARERNRQLEQELAALKSTPAKLPEQTQATQEADTPPAESNEQKLERLRDEWREAMFSADTEQAKKLERQVDALNRQIWSEEQEAKEAQRKEKEAESQAIKDATARAAQLIEKYPFLDPENPAANGDAIDLVVAKRNSLMAEGVSFADAVEQAVEKVAPLFVKGSATQQTDAEVARKAAEAISKAKAPIATSLSQAPAGTKPMHDEGEVIRNMDVNRLTQSLESKTPEEIMKFMAKAL